MVNSRRCFVGLRVKLALAVALLCTPAAVFASETGPNLVPSSDSSPTIRDLQVLLRVRHALTANETLAPNNVGVSVRNGLATLWGPVASREELRLAVKTAEQVRGVTTVRSELYIAKDAKPTPPVFVLPDTATPRPLAPTDALVTSGERTYMTTRDRMFPDMLKENLAAVPSLPAPGTATLRAPVFGDFALTEPKTVTTARAEGVPAAIERLQKTDARFGHITADWNDGTIVLRGNRNESSAVMGFARLLSDVPGVERIVVQNSKK